MPDETTVYNIRLTQKELKELEGVANKHNLNVAHYLRKCANMKPLDSVLAYPQISYMISTPYFQCGEQKTWSESITDQYSEITW